MTGQRISTSIQNKNDVTMDDDADNKNTTKILCIHFLCAIDMKIQTAVLHLLMSASFEHVEFF